MNMAVVGHVEWIELVRVEAVPRPGEIVGSTRGLGGARRWWRRGGGGLARLAGRSPRSCLLGGDDLGAQSRMRLGRLALAYSPRCDEPPAAGLVLRGRGRGQRPSTVMGTAAPAGWRRLAALGGARRRDGVYFTAGDAEAVRQARRARVLVATARELRPARPGSSSTRSSRAARTTPSAIRSATRSAAAPRRLHRGRSDGRGGPGGPTSRPCRRHRSRTPTAPATASPPGSRSRSRRAWRSRTRSRSPPSGERSRSPAAAPASRADRLELHVDVELEEACEPSTFGGNGRNTLLRQRDVADDESAGPGHAICRGRARRGATAPQPTDHLGPSSARSDSETKRLRSSWESRTLSYSGRKRTGAGERDPGEALREGRTARGLARPGTSRAAGAAARRPRAGRSAGTTSSRPPPTQARTRRYSGGPRRRATPSRRAAARATSQRSSTEPGRASARGRAAEAARVQAASGRRRRALRHRVSEIGPRVARAARPGSRLLERESARLDDRIQIDAAQRRRRSRWRQSCPSRTGWVTGRSTRQSSAVIR